MTLVTSKLLVCFRKHVETLYLFVYVSKFDDNIEGKKKNQMLSQN